MKTNNDSRRDFIKKTLTGVTTLSIGGILPGVSAKSYASILGANELIRVAVMGVNSRGLALANYFAKQQDCEIIYVCDVDSNAIAKCINSLKILQKKVPEAAVDFRKTLDDKQMDAIVIAVPDHWHVPAAILSSKAGKHVYLETPCSHNPSEGELISIAPDRYENIIQMGNQLRSSPNVISAISELQNGVIGRPYYAKTWYTNNRPSIGRGKEVAIPSWLDYELWQGPAPRKPYRDNLIHNNWHWFWNWGTGEALNNGTHFVDLGRWGLGVDYPASVSSSGGRYRYQDDWETPDTQVITMEFNNNTSMVWEGLSCNGRLIEGSTAGVIFSGENGSLRIDENSYTVFDLQGKLVKEVKSRIGTNASKLSNTDTSIDVLHIKNFFDSIREGIRTNADILGGHKSTLLVQLGNIALRSGNTLHIDSTNGHIKNDPVAMKYWSREYQPGWEPEI